MDKIAGNYFFIYTHLGWFLLCIWPISSFLGVLRCLLQISIDEVKSGQSYFERLEPWGGFTEIWIHHSIFRYSAKEDSPFVPFSGQLGKFSFFPLQIECFLLHYCSFQLSSARCDPPFNYSTAPAWQLRLTKQVHRQKFPLKKIIFSSRPLPSWPEKGTNGLSFALEGKIKQRIQISARKSPHCSGQNSSVQPWLHL